MNSFTNNTVCLIEKLNFWYQAQCNGDWEHQFGISINTIDNPGWKVVIDLCGTRWENLSIERITIDHDNHQLDWMHFEISNSKFIGTSSPMNLSALIEKFFEATA